MRTANDSGLSALMQAVAVAAVTTVVVTAVVVSGVGEKIPCGVNEVTRRIGGSADPGCQDASAQPPGSEIPGWELAFWDEFEGDRLDTDNWTAENYSTRGDGNEELACLMSRPENLAVSGGTLKLTAQQEDGLICGSEDTRFPEGRPYSSAMIASKGKQEFTYGRFEVRAKLPTAPGRSKGMWPAFWMRPGTGSLGEIDILEAVGTGPEDAANAAEVGQTLHYDYEGTFPKEDLKYALPQGDPSDGFHIYAVEWEEGSLKWYVDDELTNSLDSTTTPWLDDALSTDFFMRLNLAVGGKWPGAPTPETTLPASYEVDYVRVYQR